jgi:hypothetical protein
MGGAATGGAATGGAATMGATAIPQYSKGEAGAVSYRTVILKEPMTVHNRYIPQTKCIG